MVVSIGVFSIMVASLSATFASGFSAFGNSRELQRNLDTAQYAMNTLAKYLRTSTVATTASSQNIIFYDYSSERCIEYNFNGSVLRERWKSVPSSTITYAAGVSDVITVRCNQGVLAGCGDATCTWTNLTSSTGSITGSFTVNPSTFTPKHLGRVTIFFSVQKDAASVKKEDIQTTVSLRDYQYVGSL